MKRVGIVLGILLILVFLTAVLAPFLIDLNPYKERILSRIEPYVPREVDFEHIELTVLSGLGAELRGLRVADNPAFSDGDFLELEGLQVRVMALPLLRGQIKVKELVLKRPVIRLSRNADGVFSFRDLLEGTGEKRAAGGGRPPGEETPDPGEAPGGIGLLGGLLVSEFTIEQGRVVYQDEVLWPGERPLVISSLDVEVRDLALDRPVSIRLAADLLEETGQNVELTGTLGPAGEDLRPEAVPFDIRLSLRRLSLGALGNLFAEKVPLRVRSGRAEGVWEIKGSLDRQVVSEADLELQDLRLGGDGTEAEAGSDSALLQCRIAEKAVLDLAAEKLVVDSLEVSLNGERIQAQGVVDSFRTEPRWEAKVWTEGFRPELLIPILPAASLTVPPELGLQGPLAVSFESQGSLQEFDLDARLDLEGMKIDYKDLLQKQAGVKCSIGCQATRKEDRLTLKDFEVVLHTLALNASGEVVLAQIPRFGFLIQTSPIGLEGWDALCPFLAPYQLQGSFLVRSSVRGTPDDTSVNLQVASDRIAFVTPPSGEDGEPEEDRSGHLESWSIKVQAKRRDKVIVGDGRAEIKTGRYVGVPFQKLLATANYRPEVLEISGFEMSVFQGEVRATGSYEPVTGKWRFQPTVRDVAVGDVLDQLTEYKGVFSGTFRGRFEAGGRTGPGEEKDVDAAGSFRVSQGELKNFDLVGSVTDTLFGLKGVEQRLESTRQEVREHASTRFDWVEGDFRMRGGILHLEGLQLRNVGTSKATDSDALLEGAVDLERQQLDLKGRVILAKRHSAELAEKAEVIKALYNAEQRVVLPVALKGSTSRPVAFLDVEYVLGAFSRYYARQGVQRLREELGLPEGEKPEEEKPGERLLRELFQNR